MHTNNKTKKNIYNPFNKIYLQGKMEFQLFSGNRDRENMKMSDKDGDARNLFFISAK